MGVRIKIKMKKIKIFCDSADIKSIKSLIKSPYINGITTNPSLMRKEGVKNYKKHCQTILKLTTKPISFEVFGDNFLEIKRQAMIINSWGKNIYVKVPITNTKGLMLTSLIKELQKNKIKLNITAVFTLGQIKSLKKALNKKTKCIISIFAGRIADIGTDPERIIKTAVKLFKNFKNVEILWASFREPLNYYQAKNANCHIVTIPPGFIYKLKKKKPSLKSYSLTTVKDFYSDGKKSKFKI